MNERSRILKTLTLSDSRCTVPKVKTQLQIKVIHSDGLPCANYKRGFYLCADYVEQVDNCNGETTTRHMSNPPTVLVRPTGRFNERALSKYFPEMHEIQDLLDELPTVKGVKAFQVSDILF